MPRKQCFVISPIGDDGTDIRAEADALLWVIKSALEKYNFEVVRVDQIARSAIITNEIVQLIQESDLCVSVLTGQNPNVFYETGRRHETGKPFIQLIKKGDRIPFDVAGIRTILYDDIETRTAAAKTIEDIQRYLEEFEKSGYGSTGTGISLSTLASTLDRLERKVGQLLSHATASHPAFAGAASLLGKPEQQTAAGLLTGPLRRVNPKEAFLHAVMQGDIEQATAILLQLQRRLSSRELLSFAVIPAHAGSEPAVEIILNLLADDLDDVLEVTDDDGDRPALMAIGSVATYYISVEQESEGLSRLEPIINRVLAQGTLESKERAILLNQMQRLHFGAGNLQEALQLIEHVLQLAPEDPSYLYNSSLIYERLGLDQKSAESIDRCLAFDAKDDDDHLSHAVQVYVKVGRIEDAKQAFEKLRKLSVVKASMVTFLPGVKQGLGLE